MAKPIEPTPILEGKDAQRFLRDFRKYKLTPKKEKELKKCAKLYEKMRPKNRKFNLVKLLITSGFHARRR